MPSRCWNRDLHSGKGFTLLELLAVMGIIVLVVGFMTPIVHGLKGAGGLSGAASEIAGTLERARAYAMANNTYVFVGFSERDGLDASKMGDGQVFMIMMGSKDGTQSFGTDGSNLTALSKLKQLRDVHLEGALPDSAGVVRPKVNSNYSLGNAGVESPETFSAAGCKFAKIIQFDSRGTATVEMDNAAVPQWVEIGLVGTRGNTVDSGKNWAALILDGVTGSVRIYRP